MEFAFSKHSIVQQVEDTKQTSDYEVLVSRRRVCFKPNLETEFSEWWPYWCETAKQAYKNYGPCQHDAYFY